MIATLKNLYLILGYSHHKGYTNFKLSKKYTEKQIPHVKIYTMNDFKTSITV